MDLYVLFLFMLMTLVFSWFIKPRYLFWVMAIFYCIFGGMEALSVIQSGETISTHTSLFNLQNPLMVTLFCGSFLGVVIALTVHFKIRKK